MLTIYTEILSIKMRMCTSLNLCAYQYSMGPSNANCYNKHDRFVHNIDSYVLQEWFTKQGIHFSPAMLRPQLLQLARVNRPPPEYTVDQTIRLHGLEVLRLPPCHPDFNAIELIWSQLKDYVRRMNTSFRCVTCSRLMIIILQDLFMI